MVREIGGEYIDLRVIAGPLSDAHTFEPGPADARALGSARVLFVNGLNFETWIERLIESAGFAGRLVVASAGIQPLPADGHDHHHGAGDAADHAHEHDDADAVDPHAWQDLAHGIVYIQNIAQGLAQADPAHASAYYARADTYIGKLRRADAKWRRELSAIAPGQRVIATSHQAFDYFAAAYGISVLALAGPSSEAEPSAHAMAQLIRQVQEQGIRALFPEQGGNSRALEQISRETGVPLGEALYADTLARPGHQASTYLGMFQWNTGHILHALTALPADAQEPADAPGADAGE